jgi:hypothetical protein
MASDIGLDLVDAALGVRIAAALGFPHLARRRADELRDLADKFVISLTPDLARITEAEEAKARAELHQ